MRPALLDLLRCPHCGDRLALGDRVDDGQGRVERGVLWDECAAYPVLAGIAYLRADEPGRQALEAMGSGDPDGALAGLLAAGLPSPDVAAGLLVHPGTFRDAVAALVPGPEADYLLHRFSDPVFRGGDHLFRAAAADRGSGPVLDFGGGAGHLTRGLLATVSGTVVLADVAFAKLWLATRFVAPAAEAVCCDGNQVLPFETAAFALVTSSDAFHYVWSRRLLAAELLRVRRPDGALVLAHLHNLLRYNPSAGMPLTPAGYRRLLGPGARLLPDDELLEAALAATPLRLHDRGDEELASADALAAVVGDLPEVLPPPPARPVRRLEVNPLYRRGGAGDRWVLVPPTPMYAEEYAAMHRYLPSEVDLPDELLRRAAAGTVDDEVAALLRSVVLVERTDPAP